MFATLLLRLWVAPAALPAITLATLVDAAVLAGFSIAMGVAIRTGRGIRDIAGVIAVAAFMIGWGTLGFWHAWFLDVGAEFRFSLLGTGPGTFLFFVREIAPWNAWLALLLFWVLIAASLRVAWFDRLVPAGPAGWNPAKRFAAGSGLVVCGLAAAATTATGHPVSPTIREALSLSRLNEVRATDATFEATHLDLRDTLAGPVGPHYSRVLVFVMEGVTRTRLDEALPGLPADGFFARTGPIATKYAGYHTVNQESRTARMAMLHSLMIPYEAYVADWADRFGPVFRAGGMVGMLNGNGWRTAFAIPMIDAPWDLRLLPWHSRIGIEAADFDRDGYTCLAPTEFDRGCEDRILIDRVDSLIAAAGPLFLFQPFLFGHTDRWEATTGVDRVAYYDRYLADVLDRVARAGLADSTLIVVTSDHGPRSLQALRRPESYEVPLWLVHPSFRGELRAGHFTSTEFRRLIMSTLREGQPPRPERRPWILAVGPTTQSAVMCNAADGTFVLLRLRKQRRAAVLRQSGGDRESAALCAGTFYRYRDNFDSAYPRGRPD